MNLLRIVQGSNPASRHLDGSIIINKTDELLADPGEKIVVFVVNISELKHDTEYPGRHKDYIVGTFMATNKIDYQIVFRGPTLHVGTELRRHETRQIYLEAQERCTKTKSKYWLWTTEIIEDEFDDLN